MAAPRRPRGKTTPKQPRYTPLPTIPSQPQQLPVPRTAPPPAPSVQHQAITERERVLREPEGFRRNIWLVMNRLYGQQSATGQARESLPAAGLSESGLPPSQFSGDTTPSRFGVRGAPIEFGGRRYSAHASLVSRGIRPPLITFSAQEYFGYTAEDLGGSGYELTAGGWVRKPVTGTVVDDYLSGDSGGGTSSYTLPSFPTYGGGSSSRLSSSALINWRI